MNEKNIGSIISKLREEKNITQKELADNLNISDKAISKWETGMNLPPLDMIYRLSKFFNVSFQKLLKVRLEDENVDEKIINEIIDEFNESNKRKTKVIKIALIVTLVISLILAIAFIFTYSYNKFKVYTIQIENKDFNSIKGIYVETRIKDTLYLDNIRLNNIEIDPTDSVSVDIYILDNGEEKLLQNFSRLYNISFSNYQSYIKIENLSDYFDRLYLRVTIIDKKNNVEKYEGRLEFTIDFSNNKIYDNNITDSFKTIEINRDDIKAILLDNGFKETSENIIMKSSKKLEMIYYYDSNKLSYRYENNDFSYKYIYYFDTMKLKVDIFDENNTEIGNYFYDVLNDEVTECIVGKCNDYDEAMELLDKDILNLIYDK